MSTAAWAIGVVLAGLFLVLLARAWFGTDRDDWPREPRSRLDDLDGAWTDEDGWQ